MANTSQTWYRLLRYYGLNKSQQAYCFRHPNGTIHGRNINKKMNPASVTKLYVTFFALKKLGAHHQYKTTFHYKKGHLHIEGGQDNFFTTDSLNFILGKLNKMGITQVDRLTFDNQFYFNWTRPYMGLAWLLKSYVNTYSWNEIQRMEFSNLEYQLGELDLNIPLPPSIDFSADKVYVKNNAKISSFDFKLEYLSSPLSFHLKQMNIYSNNFIGWNLFNDLGGEQAFNKFMLEEFSVGRKSFRMENGAGFSPNKTTCRLTLYLMEELERQVAVEGIKITDIISVPGEDLGTLSERFQDEYKKTLVAKTGTLKKTSSLAGLLNTDGRRFPFTIFNHTVKHWAAIKIQDHMVRKMFNVVGPYKTYRYENTDYISLLKTETKIDSFFDL